jgi:hypothetical protein
MVAKNIKSEKNRRLSDEVPEVYIKLHLEIK